MSASRNFGLRNRALTGDGKPGYKASPSAARDSSRQRKPSAPASPFFLSARKRSGSEFDGLKESILGTLVKTDLRAIDAGLMAFTSGLAESELHLRGFSDDEEDEDSDSDLSPPSSAAAASEERTVRSSSAAGPGRGKGRERLRNNGKTTAARREVSEKGAAVGADADAVAAAAKATAAAAAAARARGSTTHGGGTVGRAATMAAKRKAANSALQELARVSNDGAGDDDSDEENDKDAPPWAVIKIRSETEIVKSLDPRFFAEDYDPVARILDDLRDFQASTLDRPDGRPGLGRSDSSGGRRVSAADGGGSGGITAGSGGRPGWDEYLEHQLRDMDVARAAVTRQIASMVQENYAALVGGMRQVQAVDLDLARAGVQISNGRRALHKSMARVTGPVIRLGQMDRRRDRLKAVRTLAASCLEAIAEEGKIEGDLASGRFTQAVAKAENLSETLTANVQLSALAVLSGARERTGDVIHTVRTRARNAVSELCQTFSPERYGGIITAFLMLEDRGALLPPPPPPPAEKSAHGGSQGDGPNGVEMEGGCPWISKGLADCPLPLPQSLLRSALSPERESLPGVGKTAEEAGTGGEEAGVDVDRVGREPSEEELLVLPGGEGAHAGENADGVDACAGGAGAEAGENGAGGADPGEDKRTGVEMLADHILACFVEEFNRRLSDAMFEVSLSDQGMNPGEQLRRGSLRAFEPPPPLFLPAPQLLEGTVQICHGAAELLHTHFCYTQWHASAFDERLEDDAFLHTAGASGSPNSPRAPEPVGAPSPARAPAPVRAAWAVRSVLSGLRLSGGGEPAPGSEGERVASGVAEAGSGAGASADPRVKVLHELLVAQRRVLWEEIETKMIKLLSEASVSGGALELEDLAGVVGAVGLLATIGDEFVGPDPERPVTGTATAMGAAPTEVDEGRSEGAALPAEFDGGRGDSGGGGTGKAGRRSAGHALRERLSDMAKEFFQGANKEGVTVLKQMLEMEAWERVPIPFKPEDGGVGALIDSNAQRFCSPHRVYRGIRAPYLHLMHDVMSLHQEAKGEKSLIDPDHHHHQEHQKQQQQQQHSQRSKPLLREWHRSGNPFKILGQRSSEESSIVPSGAAANATANVREGAFAGVGFGRLPPGMDDDDDPYQAAVWAADAGGGRGSRGGERGLASLEEELEVEESRYGSGWVVTQAALNGVARYAGHALQIMALVRPAAPSAFEGLRQLVDLYLYCAFTLFTPQWAIDGLYGFGDEELVPPPEEQERLTTLKSFMTRVSHRLTSPNGGGGAPSSNPSPQLSPERSQPASGAGAGGKNKTPVMGGGGGGGSSETRAGSGRPFRRPQTRSGHTSTTPPRQPVPATANQEAQRAAGTTPTTTAEGVEGLLGGAAAAHPRGRTGRGSRDSSPVAGSSRSPILAGKSRGEMEASEDAAAAASTAGWSDESALWLFRGGGEATPKQRTGSNTGTQGLFLKRSGRHLTPRAPIALPSCMARPRKSSDLSLLFVGNDALWGGGGPGDNGPCGALRETLEWRSLGQRAVAVESCLFVVQVLKAARRRTLGLGLLPASQRTAVDAYVGEVEQAAAQLRRFLYRTQGTGLAGGAAIAAAAEAQTWTVKQFRNDAHPYVERCIARCRRVREAIYGPGEGKARGGNGGAQEPVTRTGTTPASPSEGGGKDSATVASGVPAKATPAPAVTGRAGAGGMGVVAHAVVPARARTPVWMGVVDAALLSLLRGFSRATRCSTEGRALMSMDLQALALGLGDPAAAQAAKAHVHAYVNAFYFGDEDLLAWIKERWRSYPMYQMVSLLQCGDGSAAAKVLRKRRVRDLVAQVESLYFPRITASGASAAPSGESNAGTGVRVAGGGISVSGEGLNSSSFPGAATIANAATTTTATEAGAALAGAAGSRRPTAPAQCSE